MPTAHCIAGGDSSHVFQLAPHDDPDRHVHCILEWRPDQDKHKVGAALFGRTCAKCTDRLYPTSQCTARGDTRVFNRLVLQDGRHCIFACEHNRVRAIDHGEERTAGPAAGYLLIGAYARRVVSRRAPSHLARSLLAPSHLAGSFRGLAFCDRQSTGMRFELGASHGRQ